MKQNNCHVVYFFFAVGHVNLYLHCCQKESHVVTIFFTSIYRKKKSHDLTIFSYIRLPPKKTLHNVTMFLYMRLPQRKKLHDFTAKKKMNSFTQNKKCMHVANLPTYGPLLVLSPALKRWGPPDGSGYVATGPTSGPFLILSPALKRWGPLTRPCQVRPLLTLPLLKGILEVPSQAKQSLWGWEIDGVTEC